MRARIVSALVLASIGFGLSGVAIRSALDEGLEPLTMVTLRSALAGVAVVTYLKATGGSIGRDRALWRLGAVLAVLNMVVPFLLFTLAYQYASAGFVGLLAALMPLATAVCAHYLVPGETITTTKLTGMLIALGGVGFLMASGDSGLAIGGRPVPAILLSLGAVVSIGIASAYARRHKDVFTALPITGIQFLLGTAVLVPMMLVAEGVPSGITATGWALVAFLALASSFMPFVLFYWVLRNASATTASLNSYLVPLVSLIGGVLLLDERIQPAMVLGGALILAGVLMTNRAERRPATDHLTGPGDESIA